MTRPAAVPPDTRTDDRQLAPADGPASWKGVLSHPSDAGGRMLARYDALLATERRTIGLALVRIAVSVVLLL